MKTRKINQRIGASAGLGARTAFWRKSAQEKAIRSELREVRRAQNNLPGVGHLVPIAAKILERIFDYTPESIHGALRAALEEHELRAAVNDAQTAIESEEKGAGARVASKKRAPRSL